MQNDFVQSAGFFGKVEGQNMKIVEAIVPAVSNFLSFARRSGMKRVFVKTLHFDYTNTNLWNTRLENEGRTPQLCVPGSWGAEIVDELKPIEGEPVVIKHRYDAFLDTDLSLILRTMKVKNILISGTKTNVCVDTTTRHGFMNGFLPVVLKDCVATPDAGMQETILWNLGQYFGYVAPTEEIIQNLQRGVVVSPQMPAQKDRAP